VWLLAAIAVACGPSTARAQPEPFGLPVEDVDVETLPIFDAYGRGSLTWLYRAANAVHFRTRPGTVLSQMPFNEGQPWTPDLKSETERVLRGLSFLIPVLVQGSGQDSASIRVVTRDVWTTTPEFNFESSGGKRYGKIGLAERNLFGLGKTLAFAVSQRPEGTTRSFEYNDPGIARSRIRARVGFGDGAEGASSSFGLYQPFYALDTRRTFGYTFDRSTSRVRLYANNAEVAGTDRRLEQAELWWGHGSRVEGVIRRFRYSLLHYDRRLGPADTQPGAPVEFEGGESSLRLRRLSAELILWNPRYLERWNVDRMRVVEDIDAGPLVGFQVGYAPLWLGSSQNEGYVRTQLGLGTDQGSLGYGTLWGSVEGRITATPKETLYRLNARWVTQAMRQHTLVLAALGEAATNPERDFQIVYGGLNGLRAYPVHAVAGTRGWRLNGEARIALPTPSPDFLSFGVVGFTDAARMWGAGAAGTSWFSDAGVGLRVSMPRLSLGRIVRVDVAWPISPTRDEARERVVSIGSSQAF